MRISYIFINIEVAVLFCQKAVMPHFASTRNSYADLRAPENGIFGAAKELENKSSIIDLPNNEKGIAIDVSNIEDMTEEDIDDILDKIINENKRNSNDGPDKREE